MRGFVTLFARCEQKCIGHGSVLEKKHNVSQKRKRKVFHVKSPLTCTQQSIMTWGRARSLGKRAGKLEMEARFFGWIKTKLPMLKMLYKPELNTYENVTWEQYI